MQAGLCYFLAIPVLNVSLYKWMKYRISANSVLISAAEHLLAVISTLSESKNCVPFSLVDQVSLIACLSSRLIIWMGQKHIFVKVLLDVQASGPFFMFGAQVNTRENVLFWEKWSSIIVSTAKENCPTSVHIISWAQNLGPNNHPRGKGPKKQQSLI